MLSFSRARRAAILAGGGAPNPLAAVPWKAQWKFNNSGADAIGANTLTNNNSATFTNGKLGGSTGATQLVSASTQFWSVASNSNLQAGANDILLTGWFYPDTSHLGIIIAKGANGVAGGEYRVYINGTTLRFDVSNASATLKFVTATASVGAWHWFAAWRSTATDKIYLNVDGGTTQETDLAGLIVHAGTEPLYIGDQNAFSSPFNGKIDNVAFAKGTGAVPTAAILSALYNGGAGTESFT